MSVLSDFRSAISCASGRPAGARRAGCRLRLLLRHHRNLLGRHRRIHPLGWAHHFWFGYTPQEWSYFKLIGLAGTPPDRIDGVMIIGMLLGALCAALWANNVSLRWPTSRRRLLQGLVGGIIAGFGARLAMGCNRRPSSPAFQCSRCMPGLHAGHRGRRSDWREDLPAAPAAHAAEGR